MQIELVKGGELPRYSRDGDACVDFYAREDVEWTVTSGIHTATVPLGVKVKVPNGYGLFLFSRSGMGFKDHVTLINSVGVIDNSYRDELMCKLVWQGVGFAEPSAIKKGQRVCQGCIIETPKIYFDVVDSVGNGKDGFGSSGL